MSDPVQHLKQSERTLVPWRVRILTWLLGVRFALYFYDWWQKVFSTAWEFINSLRERKSSKPNTNVARNQME